MNESKIELTERLRRENRWPEAANFKETARTDFRAKGMKRAEAAEAAWEAMAEAFPPLSVAEALADPGAPEGTTTHAPPVPWPDLPTDADFADEVRWVHSQYIRIIEETARGRAIHWERATTPPPSTGACSLARWAAENRTAFYKDMLPRVMAKVDDQAEEEAKIRRERMALEEIDELLREMDSQWAEELAANAPETIRAKVCSILEDWGRRSALTIPGEAKADLEGHISRLVDDCLDILAPSAGGE